MYNRWHVSKLSEITGSPIRDHGSFKVYQCNNGATELSPHEDVSNCSIYDNQFKTLIEHGDWYVY